MLDYTGKADTEGGAEITQGASLMAISAFAKAGARLVERFDTSVGELELKYANNKLISDDKADRAGERGDFRKIMAGSIPGSDYYFIGGITELNSNIRSVGADAYIGDLDATDPKAHFGNKLFVINVGVDLRLVDTRTLEVVDVISYQKQVIGRELSAGIFTFGNNNIFDIGAGERSNEPLQLAVRSTIERAVLEMTANLYGVANSSSCGALAHDSKGVFKVNSVTGVDVSQPGASDSSVRAYPDRWNDKRNEGVKAASRGRSTAN